MDRNVNHCRVQRDQHSQLVLSRINSLWKANELTDVTLLTEDGAMIQAHKLVLAASSDYFRKIFQQCPAQNPIIVCGGKHFEQMESIVKFIYQGENQLREDHLLGFRQACQEFQIQLPDNIKYHPLPRTPQQKPPDEPPFTKTSTNALAKSLIPPPPLKKRKIVKPEYNVPSQLELLLQKLPGLAPSGATNNKKEPNLARDSPLNLSLIGSSKKEFPGPAVPVLDDASKKFSKDNVVLKESSSSDNSEETNSKSPRYVQEELQAIEDSTASDGDTDISMTSPVDEVQNEDIEAKVSDAGDIKTVENSAEIAAASVREDHVERCIDAENLKKALDNFTSKLSVSEAEADEINPETIDDTVRIIKREAIDGAKQVSGLTLPATENASEVRTDTTADTNRQEETEELDEINDDEDLSDPETDRRSDADVNFAPRYDQTSMRTSDNFASTHTTQSSFKSKPKLVSSSKANAYPSLHHQQQQYQNFVAPYGFDPEHLRFSNYHNMHNPFMNPNFSLNPTQLLANLSSSLTAQTATQPRARKPNLPKKPLKLVKKKPTSLTKLLEDYQYQWPTKKINSVSSSSNSSHLPAKASCHTGTKASSHLGNNKASASSSSSQSQFALLRNILTQPTPPKKSKPCTATSSSDASNAYSVTEYNASQYPSTSSNSKSWSNGDPNGQKNVQKSRPKPKIKRSTQYTCSECSKQFIYFKAFQEHLNSHIYAIHCPGCTKTFASRGFLERHLDSGKCSMKKK